MSSITKHPANDAAFAPTPKALDELPEAIRQFIDSTNGADGHALLACFNNDAVLIDYDRNYAGITAITDWNRTDNIGVGSRISLLAIKSCFQGFRLQVAVTGNGFNGTGQMNFQLFDGKITLLVIK
ncbi:nuclear transport factor 2 family protein [Agrobacterium sp. T29]|uniref:nuclear transport factor 2 family protein n=1 Tax=Agrobacterium sp. T29 TaxID=2580515 RepID=UPI001FF068C8|nr:nuclear transport factor 2 family protein [Agrobacterium sp. T29]